MNKMNTSSKLTARINRFLDRKLPLTGDLTELTSGREKHTQRRYIEVNHTPYISLAVK